jgi:hypothetical protein
MEAEFAMELAYVLGAICIVYKLAFLIRQTASLPAPVVLVFRLAGVTLGTVVIMQALEVFNDRAQVGPSAVAMQAAWCLVLASIIIIIGRRQKAW